MNIIAIFIIISIVIVIATDIPMRQRQPLQKLSINHLESLAHFLSRQLQPIQLNRPIINYPLQPLFWIAAIL